jgi:hypothetical protein
MRQKTRERAHDRESSGGVHYLNLPDDYEFYKITKGRNLFSVLPYEVSVDNHPEVEAGELWYQRTIWVHYNVGSDEKTEICPLKTFKDPCPICERRMELMKDPDADEEDINALKPKEREMFNVKNEDDEIQLLFLSYHNFGKLLEEEIREDEDYGGFADLEDGHSLSVRFKMESFGGNKFLKASKIDFKSRKDLKESILDDVLDLDAIMIPKKYDDLYNEFWDVEKEDRTEKRGHDEKKEPEKKSSRNPKKKSEKKEPEKKTPEKKKAPTKKSAPKTKEKKLKCPENDLTFGKDFDEYECCDECDIREKCKKAAGKKDENPYEDPDDSSDDSNNENSGDCPHGHTFGTDCNKEDECDECNEWEACQDAHDTE